MQCSWARLCREEPGPPQGGEGPLHQPWGPADWGSGGPIFAVRGGRGHRELGSPDAGPPFSDAHRLHHVSSLAWLDEHTLVTTSHDASVKEWTITY